MRSCPTCLLITEKRLLAGYFRLIFRVSFGFSFKMMTSIKSYMRTVYAVPIRRLNKVLAHKIPPATHSNMKNHFDLQENE